MEYMIGIGVAYLVGHKILNNDNLVSKATVAAFRNPDDEFNEYVRDDNARERMKYPDDVTDQQLIADGIIMNYEATNAPNPEEELTDFNQMSWFNTPNLPSQPMPEFNLI